MHWISCWSVNFLNCLSFVLTTRNWLDTYHWQHYKKDWIKVPFSPIHQFRIACLLSRRQLVHWSINWSPLIPAWRILVSHVIDVECMITVLTCLYQPNSLKRTPLLWLPMPIESGVLVWRQSMTCWAFYIEDSFYKVIFCTLTVWGLKCNGVL